MLSSSETFRWSPQHPRRPHTVLQATHPAAFGAVLDHTQLQMELPMVVLHLPQAVEWHTHHTAGLLVDTFCDTLRLTAAAVAACSAKS